MFADFECRKVGRVCMNERLESGVGLTWCFYRESLDVDIYGLRRRGASASRQGYRSRLRPASSRRPLFFFPAGSWTGVCPKSPAPALRPVRHPISSQAPNQNGPPSKTNVVVPPNATRVIRAVAPE